MIVHPQPPHAHWPIGKVVKLNICQVCKLVGKRTYLRPVAWLVQLLVEEKRILDKGTLVVGIYVLSQNSHGI